MLTFEKKGYIAIVVAIFVPIVLYGVKFMLDNMSAHRAMMEKTASEDVKKHCAKDAALQVARNWNPGLTLGQQKAAVLKVADAVYNASPCYFTNSVIGRAIYGLDVKKGHKATNRHPYMPTNVSFTRTKPTLKTIGYSDATKYTHTLYMYCYYWNTLYAMWRSIDKGTDPQNRVSDFDEVAGSGINYTLNHHDIYISPKQRHTGYYECDGTYPNNQKYTGSGGRCSEDFVMRSPSKVNTINFGYHPKQIFTGSYCYYDDSSSSSTYKKRSEPNDPTVQVSVKDDKIKVLTDDDVGYAKPAECNVDIVLAVPVNGAACNINNLDAVSAPAVSENDTAEPNKSPFTESCYSSINGAVNTPIYQMGQACKGFVKQFYHTRGVNMSLIPYSAKVSISLDHAKEWTVAVPKFDDTSTNIQVICGAALYGTSGEAGVPLKQSYKTAALSTNETLPTGDTPYFWGGVLTGCPIMCRQGSRSQVSRYGNNYVCNGKLLDTTNPSSSSSYKFIRMNLNPCNVGYANMLTMKTEKKSRHFLPNPFYMIEPTADLVKIYEMCNALYPYYDLYNVSNFIFIPLEWANNFFQSWTRNPGCSASADNALEENQQLSRQSKMTSGRKKAVILIVNKPDWFEPGEMTYLGFNNDASEVPTVLSDKIDFSIDYSDTSKKFLDDTNYDGTIQGPNKILQFAHVSGTAVSRVNGYYESTGGTHKLVFPKKGLIKLVVAPVTAANGRVYVHHWNMNRGNVNCQCKLNSLSGSDVAFNSWHDISGPTTYVFPGPPVGYSDYINKSVWSCNDSGGLNFSGNLATHKVAFEFENAEIVDATLKHQVIRNYTGTYSYGKDLFRLILSCGKFQANMYGNYRASNEAYRPPLVEASADYEGNYSGAHAQVRDFMNYCDLCFVDDGQAYKDVQNYGMLTLTSATADCEYDMGRYTQYYIPYYFMVHGMRKARVFLSCWFKGYTYNLYYKNGSAYQLQKSGISSTDRRGWCDCGIASLNSDDVLFKLVPSVQSGTSSVYQVYVQNQEDKHYIPNCTLGDIESNAGIGWNGLYIRFCGDGELYVTVKPKLPKQASIKFSNDSSVTVITSQQTFYIEPSQLSSNYLQFSCENIRLISAEITNRPYRVTMAKSCFVTAAGSYSSSSSTAEITVTDNTTPIKAKFLVPAAPYIRFSDINNEEASYYKNNETIYFTNGEKWKRLMFPRDAFRENYNYKKLTYAMSGATISTERYETYMLNRALRYDFGPVVVHYPNINAYSDPKHDSYIHTGTERSGSIRDGDFGWIGDPVSFDSDGSHKVWRINHRAALVLPFYTDFSIPQRVYMSMVRTNGNDRDSIEIGSAADYRKWGRPFRFGESSTEHPCVTIGDDGKDLGSGGLSMPLFVDPCGYCFHNADKAEKCGNFYEQERIITYPGVYNSARGISTKSSYSFRGFRSNCISGQGQILYWCNNAGTLWTLIYVADIEPYWKQDPSHAVYVSYDPNKAYGRTGDNSRFAYCYFVDKHKAFATTDGSTSGSRNKEYVYISNTAGSGGIYFHGKGDLYLMIKPQRSRVNGISLPRKAGGSQTVEVTIPPASETRWYTYTSQGDGTYKIRLNLEYAQLQSAEYIGNFHGQYSKNISYDKIAVPSMSSVIDFSDSSKIKYDSSLLVFGNFSEGPLEKTEWDDKAGYWKVSGGYDFWDSRPYSKNDVFITTGSCDYPAKAHYLTHYFYDDYGDGRYYPSGICKSFYIGAIKSGLGILGQNYYFINAGFTKPINMVLYQYAVASSTSGVNVDSFGSHDNDFNTSNLRKLTTAACDKLKGTSVGARVYVVKYRCQDKYLYRAKPDINSTATEDKSYSHSYKEIDVCASETTDSKGNTVKHLYSASSQDELTTCLNKIADDIKNNFAEYKAAKVVE